MSVRAIWKGAVAFGLVNVPVKLYAATGEQDVPLHQVHEADGGRIRYKKTCSVCGEPVEMRDIAKGYQTDDGKLVVLTDEDMGQLPLSTEREISVLEFVPAEQVDPIMLSKTYYLEPDKTAAKPYALLREALAATDRMAVVKVALRQRESMAVLRVRDDVICLQTLLWPDEIRAADFPILDADVTVRPQELTMASSLVESLAADFDPSEFHDSYREALETLIQTKVETGSTQNVPVPAGAAEEAGGGEVIDLLSALQRSVEKARGARGSGPEAGAAASDAQAVVASGEAADDHADTAAGEADAPAQPARGRSTKARPGPEPADEPAPTRKRTASKAAAEPDEGEEAAEEAPARSARSSSRASGARSGTSSGTRSPRVKVEEEAPPARKPAARSGAKAGGAKAAATETAGAKTTTRKTAAKTDEPAKTASRRRAS
jgi:DNA end-binding protein Ku